MDDMRRTQKSLNKEVSGEKTEDNSEGSSAHIISERRK